MSGHLSDVELCKLVTYINREFNRLLPSCYSSILRNCLLEVSFNRHWMELIIFTFDRLHKGSSLSMIFDHLYGVQAFDCYIKFYKLCTNIMQFLQLKDVLAFSAYRSPEVRMSNLCVGDELCCLSDITTEELDMGSVDADGLSSTDFVVSQIC